MLKGFRGGGGWGGSGRVYFTTNSLRFQHPGFLERFDLPCYIMSRLCRSRRPIVPFAAGLSVQRSVAMPFNRSVFASGQTLRTDMTRIAPNGE